MSDPSDPRVCIIQSLTMDSPGRPPVTIDLMTPGSETTLKDKPFKIKEGSKFTMSATFKVQHEILSGLHYVQVVKRKGVRVSKDSEMIVSSPPLVLRNYILSAAPQKYRIGRRKKEEEEERKKKTNMGSQGSYAPNTDKQTLYTKKCTPTL